MYFKFAESAQTRSVLEESDAKSTADVSAPIASSRSSVSHAARAEHADGGEKRAGRVERFAREKQQREPFHDPHPRSTQCTGDCQHRHYRDRGPADDHGKQPVMAPLTRLDAVDSSRSLHPGSGRSGMLPASTSESALAIRTRQGKKVEPPPPPPPAQPKRVRPFILRAKNAPASSAKSPKADPDRGPAIEGDGALRKSKTSFELERKTGSPSKPRKSPQYRDENVPPPLPSLHGTRAGQYNELEQLQPANGLPKRTSRPQSLATSSLRALGKLASSASSAAGAPRRRPLSYVVSPSSPPRSRASLHPVESPVSSPSRTPRFRPRGSAAAHAESPTASRTSSQTATPISSRTLPSQAPRHGGLQRRAESSPPHAIKTQSRHAAVEQHKSALKRKTLEERQARSSPASSSPSLSRSPAVVSAGALLDQAEGGAQPRAGLTRSRRWFGGDPSVQDSTTSDDALWAVEDRALTGQDAYATPPPSIRGSSAIAARKRESYAVLAATKTGAGPRVVTDKDEQQRTGFASLQEVRRSLPCPFGLDRAR